MSSVKGLENPSNQRPTSASSISWQWLWIGILLLMAPASYYSASFLNDPTPLLDQAIELLRVESGGSGPPPPARQVREAKQALQRYLKNTKRGADSATLLLLVCDWYEGRPVDGAQELDRISLAECSTKELTTAAMVAFQVNDFPSADRLISAALERQGFDRNRALRAASVIRFDSGRHEEVLAHCRELSQLDPEDSRPWVVATSVYEKRSDWPKVVASYREVLARPSLQKLAERQTMIGFLLKSSNVDEARGEFDKLLKDWPELPQVDPLLEAKLLYQEGNAEQALPGITRTLLAEPDNWQALWLLGKVQFERGEFEKATATLERLIEIQPLNHEARYVLGQVYHRSGREAESEQMFVVYRQLTDIKAALFDFEARAAKYPRDVHAREQLVRIYDQLGAKKEADIWRKSLGQAISDQ